MRLSILVVAALVATVPAAAQSRTSGPAQPVDLTSARKDLKGLLTAQEVFFTNNNRYSPTVTGLQLAATDTVEVKILEFAANAYSASATIKGKPGVSCVMFVGYVSAMPKTAGGMVAKAEGQVVCDGD